MTVSNYILPTLFKNIIYVNDYSYRRYDKYLYVHKRFLILNCKNLVELIFSSGAFFFWSVIICYIFTNGLYIYIYICGKIVTILFENEIFL